ncbi:hypothetical protein ACFLQ2_00930 [archaeon]
MKNKRGFAVFTPMVGLLVILITMLIVSSIIANERIAVQGSVKSYRSSELVNLASEAQTTVVEQVRTAITSRLEKFYEGTGEPVMKIKVLDCPPPDIADNINFDEPECDDGTNTYPCVCDDEGTPCFAEETCWGQTFNEVNLTAGNELIGKGLVKSSIEHTLAAIANKYDLARIEPSDVELDEAITGIEFLDCEIDYDPFRPDESGDCGDGRIRVTVDFSELEGKPIAEVISEGKRLQVFMPPEQREYTTNEPFMQYAKLTADLFNQFQLLNESWHGAGGEESHNPNYKETDGSEWYHYNYAEHDRYYGTPGKNTFASDWAPGFAVEQSNLGAVDPYDYFDDGETLTDYIQELLTPARKRVKGADVITGEEDTQNFRFDTSFDDDNNWAKLLNFVSGYATDEEGKTGSTMSLGSSVAKQGTVFPGGCISPSATPGACATSGIVYNCLVPDTTFDNIQYSSSTIVVNTSADYDKKLTERMGDQVDGMLESILDNGQILNGLGVGFDKPLDYKLIVTSKQYYAEGKGFSGGDNWRCGQFLTLYQTRSAGTTCSGIRQNFGGGKDVYANCVAGSCSTPCAGGKGGNCPWFISEPIDWECSSRTLYRVEETYRLYRSTTTSAEPTRPVFMAEYNRGKDAYPEVAAGGHDTGLWTFSDKYLDITSKDDAKDSGSDEVSSLRKCTYTYTTEDGGGLEYECSWIPG